MKQDKLIFLISQPRAGSTMLQRMLSAHPDIHTTAEPWLLLPPLYALRDQGHRAEYDSTVGAQALQSFLGQLPQGREAYFAGLRKMYLHLYRQALEGTGSSYFLDKTPRYHLILQELAEVFPRARFVILLRNPLAVLCSMISTWTRYDFFRLWRLKLDLLKAPANLLRGIELLGDRALVVRYEDLVMQPESRLLRLCQRLGVSFSPQMVDYGAQAGGPWPLGDQVSAHRLGRPETRYLEAWRTAILSPKIWRLARDYLVILGPEKVEGMGYDWGELEELLERNKPSRVRLLGTVPLKWALRDPRQFWRPS